MVNKQSVSDLIFYCIPWLHDICHPCHRPFHFTTSTRIFFTHPRVRFCIASYHLFVCRSSSHFTFTYVSSLLKNLPAHSRPDPAPFAFYRLLDARFHATISLPPPVYSFLTLFFRLIGHLNIVISATFGLCSTSLSAVSRHCDPYGFPAPSYEIYLLI